MAKCKYLLKLPGGGTIELPASFGTLDQDNKLDSLFLDYQNAREELKDAKLKEITEFLKNKIPESIHGNTVNAAIKNSLTVDVLYQKINTLVYEKGNYNNIGEAIYNYIKSGSGKYGSKNKNIEKLNKELNQPRTSKYFKDFGLQGVIGATSLKEEKKKIYAKYLENKESGFSVTVPENLNIFLNSLLTKYPTTKDSNILYGTNNSFIGKAWSSEDVVLYELDDDLSLFLGLFKKEAVKVNVAKLAPILISINKILKLKRYSEIDLESFNLDEFFNGTITNKKITPSKFEELLEKGKDKDIAKELDAILNLISTTINEKSVDLPRALKRLFWSLSPSSYGKNNLFKELDDQKMTDDEAKIEQDYKRTLLSFMGMTEMDRDDNFSLLENIAENHYENAIKNIELNKDIVKFPIAKSNITIYGLVTGIYKRDNGVMIYGAYKNQNGDIETLKYEFKNSDEISYRKREVAVDPYVLDEDVQFVNGATISSPIPMSQKLLKQIIRKGDTVAGNLVIGVYPTYLLLKTPKSLVPIKNRYKNIKNVISAIALNEIESEPAINPNLFVQINKGEDLSEGDYYLYKSKNKKFYKRILYTDNENVYSWIPSVKGNVIVATNKKDLVGLKNAYGEMSSMDIELIKKEINLIGRSAATLSSFTDSTSAKKGDFVFYEKDNVKKYGKVLDNDKVLIFDGNLTTRTITSLANLPEAQFFTDRDISGKYSLFTLRANSFELNFKTESDSPLDIEVVYTVPNNTDLDALVMLTNGYANIGTYKQKTAQTEDEMDITELILKTLDMPKNAKVFIQKESANSYNYVKNLESLRWIKYFDGLTNEVKNELDVVLPGTYFSVYRSGDIDFNIYRIISVNEDIVKANLIKMSNSGKIITIEREFSKKALLNSDKVNGKSPINSIARLYMQNGNNKMSATIKKVNDLSQTSEQKRTAVNKSINTLIKKMKTYIKGLEVDVQLVSPEVGNFKNNQMAKIASDENGNVSILVNNEIGQKEDLLHEFLHLFLTPLRYKHPDIYNNLISSIVKDTELNVTDAEEEFVKYISKEMIKQNDFIEDFEDLNSFVKGIQTIIGDIDSAYTIKQEDNPITLLNTSLMDLFEVDREDTSNPLYNLGMVATEPMMREWMKKNNIILNCN